LGESSQGPMGHEVRYVTRRRTLLAGTRDVSKPEVIAHPVRTRIATREMSEERLEPSTRGL
jgi:hypothetical protein